MDWLRYTLGIAIIFAALADIYLTVLYPRPSVCKSAKAFGSSFAGLLGFPGGETNISCPFVGQP